MGNLIEVEIENKSYIKLQDLNESLKGLLKLTTLLDNQLGVIIKVFLNKDGERILIKNLEVRHLTPKVSGIPRFELVSSYTRKRLYLILKVDGKKVNDSEIKLAAYLRNRYLPLYIIIGIIVTLLLIFGARWIIRTISPPITSYQTTSKDTDTSRTNPQPLEYTTKSVSTETEGDSTTVEPEKEYSTKTEGNIESEKADSDVELESAEITLPNQADRNQTDQSYKSPNNTGVQPVEQTQPAPPQVLADVPSSIEQVIYFSPNNTTINRDASQLLKKLAVELKNNRNALVEISGHCAMSGTEEGREELSRERAYNIVAYLEQEGWDPETEPVVRWYGGTQPVTSNEEEMFRNRRVEINVIIP